MYRYSYKIKEEDINYGGHVGNERALLFFQWGRMSFFEYLGLSELNIGDGVGVIQKNGYVEYHQQLFLNDEIEICIKNIEFSKISFTLFYDIFKDNKLVISGNTLLVAFDYENHKIKKLPKIFIEKINDIVMDKVDKI